MPRNNSMLLLQTRMAGLALVAAMLGACSPDGNPPPDSSFGPSPTLPEPTKRLLPVIYVAPAKGWAEGQAPTVVPGLEVSAFATGLDHPRWVYVLPNGDVLVAETNAPKRPEDEKGILGWITKKVMQRAGAGVPSADRITLLRDADADGVAETKSVFLTGLYSPFGMALVGDTLYVANTDALLKFRYAAGATSISAAGVKVADLPGGPLNHHWTKNVIANSDGSRLFVTVGSNSNVAENGIDKEERRAVILEIDPAAGSSRVFASGLRNPNGLAWHPDSRALWTVVNERDELGNDLVPDYLTSVREGGFYGWPYSYYGQHVDERVKTQRPDLVSTAIVPDYALGAHTASLGLAFYSGEHLPERYRQGAFIGQHGSWNRSPLAGYKVIFVPFANGLPAGPPEDVLTGFIDEQDDARGRPVGVAVDTRGSVLVADDVGNVIWRIAAAR
ncbi:MAG TPA: sorbosone dehydrogenase family protein [Steroidobacteraceae bacterium]|nr:sorbosone dehydrogenase family protein [Steroidobacteraceae bacterium]